MINRMFLLLLFGLFLTAVQGQSNTLTDFVACADQYYGTDNLLVNGRLYTPSNPQAEGHPYFRTNEWTPGIVFIKGKSHKADRLKYNLEENQLIMKQTLANSTTKKVILSEQLVDSFSIDKHLFISQSLLRKEASSTGYLEKIYATGISFYRLNQKTFDAIYSSNRPYGQFINKQNTYYLFLPTATHKIKKTKEFLQCFPEKQKAIKKYIKEHSFKWKKANKNQFYQLLKFCNDQI